VRALSSGGSEGVEFSANFLRPFAPVLKGRVTGVHLYLPETRQPLGKYNRKSMHKPASTPAGGRCCAYYSATSDLTREHVFSAFIESQELGLGRGKAITNVKASGHEKSEQTAVTIADVCGTCNNGVPSKLDTDAAGLYEQFFAI
jgi:hypothetical protein